MLSVTMREAAQIAMGRKRTIRRTFFGDHGFASGDVLRLSVGDEKKTAMMVHVVAVKQESLKDITAKKADLEGFDTVDQFMEHWRKLYTSAKRQAPDTPVTVLTVVAVKPDQNGVFPDVPQREKKKA